MKEIIPSDYSDLLKSVKERIRTAQYEALKAVNKELIALYWDIGRIIHDKQKAVSWGKSVVEYLASDLQKEFPGIQGFSSRNIGICGISSKHIRTIQNCNHWLQKSAGQNTL